MATSAQSLEAQVEQLKKKAKLMQEEELRNKVMVKTVLLCWNRLGQQKEPDHPLGLLPKLPVMRILYVGGYIGDVYAAVTPEQLQTFLNHVVAGQQDEAEAMLKQNPDLARVSGNVTDLSNRTFQEITALQYAFWAPDPHMVTMLLKYISKEVARVQAEGVSNGPWVAAHREHAGHTIQALIDVLQVYIDNDDGSWSAEKNNHWIHEVGGAQRLLPINVLQEYCWPDRPFDPIPSFTEEILPRTLNYYDYRDSKTKDLNLSGLGSSFGLFRGIERVLWAGGWGVMWATVAYESNAGEGDRAACARLLEVRTNQREELIASLTQTVKVTPKLR